MNSAKIQAKNNTQNNTKTSKKADNNKQNQIFSAAIMWTIQACAELDIPYKILDESSELLVVYKNQKSHFYIHQTTPLNTQAGAKLCSDKMFCWQVLHENKVKTPHSISFIDPNVEEKYRTFVREKSVSEMAVKIKNSLGFPVIIKKNSGSQGKNVFKCQTLMEMEAALTQIFCWQDKEYDMVAVAQKFVDSKAEFRLVSLNGELQFAYKKDISTAQFTGNLSPLHWESGKAIEVLETEDLQDFNKICKQVYAATGVQFCGIDVIRDLDEVLWVIEVNSKPGFAAFIKDNGTEKVKKLYKTIVENL